MDHDHPPALAPSPAANLSPSPTVLSKAAKLEDRQSKGRNRHAPFQTEALNEVFARTDHPTLQERTALAKRLGMETKVVNSWFQNKRATLKKRALREATQPTSTAASDRIEDSPPPPLSPAAAQYTHARSGGIQAGAAGVAVAVHMLQPRSSHHPSSIDRSHLPLPPLPPPHSGHPSLPPISSLLRPLPRQVSPSTESDEDDARSMQLAPIYDHPSPADASPYHTSLPPAPQPVYDHRSPARRLQSAYDEPLSHDLRHERPLRDRRVSSYAPYPPPAAFAPPVRMRSLSPYDDGRWYARGAADAGRGSPYDASSQASSRSRSPPTAVPFPASHAHAWAHRAPPRYALEDARSVSGWSEPEYEPASEPESDSYSPAAAHGKRKREDMQRMPGGGASAPGAAATKTRQRLNARQVKELRDFYAHTTHPSRTQQEQLAEEIGLRVHSVTIWFQNQRSMDKRRRAHGAGDPPPPPPGPPSRVSSSSDRSPTSPSAPPSRRVSGGSVSARPRRSRPEPAQLDALKRLYAQTTTPSIEQRTRLAEEIGMETSKVTNWFRNLRQTAKKKARAGGEDDGGAPAGEEDEDMDAEDEGMSADASESREGSLGPPSRAPSPAEDGSSDEDARAGARPKRRRLSHEGAEPDPAAHDTGSDEEEAVTPPPSVGARPAHGAPPSPLAAQAFVPRAAKPVVVVDPSALRTSVAVEDAVLLLSLRGPV